MNVADFVIHVKVELPPDERKCLSDELRDRNGVMSACFSQQHPHLLNVVYDPDTVSSDILLDQVRGHGLEASKMGL